MAVTALIVPDAEVMARARAVARELPVAVDVEALVTSRARLLGLASNGRTSPGGTCRLLPAADGWVAINLARPTDLDAVPAIVEGPAEPGDPWPALAAYARRGRATDVADRCQLLGVPAAVLADPRVARTRAVTAHRLGPPGPPPAAPLVVDLSSMWAGPLCAHLLGRAGARVVKVESLHRPDGARAGDPRFFAELHAGHDGVVLDFRTPEGRAELHRLVEGADVVIEASRPRALAQLGIDAAGVVAGGRGRTWVSITGYGRTGEGAAKVAFGDDAAVAGGLVARDAGGGPLFCADAVADPLTGLFAAAAAFRSITRGGGQLVEVAMAGVARSLATGAPPAC